MEQGSKQWHQWRGKGIGGSDAPAVMGLSPWTSQFELWAHKSGLMQPAEPHPNAAAAMRRGTDLEPAARALYIERTGIVVTPKTFVHPQYDFIRVSLDGITDDGKHILELKAPGKADLAVARKGKIPPKYQWQLVHQYLCTDAETLDYATYDGDEELIILPYPRNRDLEAQLLEAEIAFWNLVTTNTPPTVTSEDLDKVTARIVKESERLQQSVKALALINDIMGRAAA